MSAKKGQQGKIPISSGKRPSLDGPNYWTNELPAMGYSPNEVAVALEGRYIVIRGHMNSAREGCRKSELFHKAFVPEDVDISTAHVYHANDTFTVAATRLDVEPFQGKTSSYFAKSSFHGAKQSSGHFNEAGKNTGQGQVADEAKAPPKKASFQKGTPKKQQTNQPPPPVATNKQENPPPTPKQPPKPSPKPSPRTTPKHSLGPSPRSPAPQTGNRSLQSPHGARRDTPHPSTLKATGKVTSPPSGTEAQPPRNKTPTSAQPAGGQRPKSSPMRRPSKPRSPSPSGKGSRAASRKTAGSKTGTHRQASPSLRGSVTPSKRSTKKAEPKQPGTQDEEELKKKKKG